MEEIIKRLNDTSELMPNGCIEWRGSYVWDGYGQVSWKNKKYRVHRLSYLLHVGEIPDGHVIRHKCDNPKCINPKHLCTGTVTDNSRDCKVRGRNIHGETHPQSKLTESQALSIIESNETGIFLSKRYGVSRSVISRIKSGKLWSHLTLPHDSEYQKLKDKQNQ